MRALNIRDIERRERKKKKKRRRGEKEW